MPCAIFPLSMAAAIAATMTLGALPAAAANPYPSKPIRIIVPAASGGGLDITTRLVAKKMEERLKQPVVVENRSGADTLLGTRAVKQSPADGYTLLAQANGFTALPAIRKDAGYDPVKDFQAIGVMARSPQVMFVSSTQPDEKLQDFVARAKARPGQLSYGSAGVGGPPHLGAAMFVHHARIDVMHVPYKGNGAAMPDVAAGRVSTLFGSYAAGIPYLQSTHMRALGVTGNARLAALPDVPTFREQGEDFTYYYWLALMAPAATPKPVIQELAAALEYAISSKDMHERMQQEGSEAWRVSPQAFQQQIAKETTEMKQLMRDLKISME